MLTKLKIQNYQKHSDLEIKLEPITVVVGRTDSGKSAIARAIRWVTLNKPNGTQIVKRGEKETKVGLKFDDNQTLVKRRTKTTQTYKLGNETYKAFGKDVPEPISDRLGIGELNFQQQHDSPLWFNEPPGKVAEHLNEIFDLKIIDKVLTAAKKKTTQIAAALQVYADDYTAEEEALSRYADTDMLQNDFNTLQDAVNDKDVHGQQLLKLAEILQEWEDNATHAAKASVCVFKWAEVLEAWEEWDKVYWHSRALSDALTRYDKVSRYKGRSVPDEKPVEDYIMHVKHIRNLEELLAECNGAASMVEASRFEYKKLKKELDTLPQICPECGKPL